MLPGAALWQDEKAARMGAFTAVMGVKDKAGKVIVKDAIEVTEPLVPSPAPRHDVMTAS